MRQSNAHAWAEYWQPGRGWLRVDPTAAVAPERIVRSRRLAPPPGFVEQALGGVDPALWQRLRDGWEALDNRWNQWVLDYSRGQQLDLLGRLGVDGADWPDLARAARRRARAGRARRRRLGLARPAPHRPGGAPHGGAARRARPARRRGGAARHAARARARG